MRALLSFLLLALSLNTSALQVLSAVVSPVSSDKINVSVTSRHAYTYSPRDFKYTIDGETITLELCFARGLGAAITTLEEDHDLVLNTTEPKNYTLIIKLYWTDINTGECFYELQDSETMPFETPLEKPAYLSINDLYIKNTLQLYPNPASDLINIKDGDITSITILDATGKAALYPVLTNGSLDIHDLPAGIYLLQCETRRGRIYQKVLKK